MLGVNWRDFATGRPTRAISAATSVGARLRLCDRPALPPRDHGTARIGRRTEADDETVRLGTDAHGWAAHRVVLDEGGRRLRERGRAGEDKTARQRRPREGGHRT